jgi:hypothetical protein
MLNIRKVQLLVLVVLIVIGLAATISAIYPSVPSKAALSWPPRQDLSASAPAEKNVAPSSYRSPLDTCFDVPLREIAGCRAGNEIPIASYRPRLDECFDVSLSDLASCREASQ